MNIICHCKNREGKYLAASTLLSFEQLKGAKINQKKRNVKKLSRRFHCTPQPVKKTQSKEIDGECITMHSSGRWCGLRAIDPLSTAYPIKNTHIFLTFQPILVTSFFLFQRSFLKPSLFSLLFFSFLHFVSWSLIFHVLFTSCIIQWLQKSFPSYYIHYIIYTLIS